MSAEFDFEPVKGLPEMLPEGERILWQGSPVWKNIALRSFHVRKIGIYFLIMMAIKASSELAAGAGFEYIALSVSGMFALGTAAVGIFTLMAWMIARTTVYTITSQRVVMRIGVAISMSINFPFALIQSASIRHFKDRSGDIPLSLNTEKRMSYIIMFPHVRPWQFAKPEPMLRGIDNVESVANILAEALAETSAGTINARTESVQDERDIKSGISEPQASAA